MEVIDPVTGDVLPERQEGELVFTTLAKEALPLLRYRSGDLSHIDAAPCPCGRTSARMARVARRTDDVVIIHGINVFPSGVAQALAEFPEVGEHFQLVVDRPGARDELEVRVELTGLPSDTTNGMLKLRDGIMRRLRQELGVDLKLSLLEPRSLRGEGEGYPRVIDRRES